MRPIVLLLTCILSFFISFGQKRAKDSAAIRQTLIDWNNAVMNKDVEKATSTFDNSPDVMLVGAVKTEMYKGYESIKKFNEEALARPVHFSWDLSDMTINQNKETAWVFVNSTFTIKRDTATTKLPYRLTIVMIKTKSGWKWKYYCGGVPLQGH